MFTGPTVDGLVWSGLVWPDDDDAARYDLWLFYVRCDRIMEDGGFLGGEKCAAITRQSCGDGVLSSTGANRMRNAHRHVSYERALVLGRIFRFGSMGRICMRSGDESPVFTTSVMPFVSRISR